MNFRDGYCEFKSQCNEQSRTEESIRAEEFKERNVGFEMKEKLSVCDICGMKGYNHKKIAILIPSSIFKLHINRLCINCLRIITKWSEVVVRVKGGSHV